MLAWRLKAGDIVLLCTDGLTDVIADSRIAERIGSYQAGKFSFDELPRRLVEDALAADTQDNITVLCCEYAPFTSQSYDFGRCIGTDRDRKDDLDNQYDLVAKEHKFI